MRTAGYEAEILLDQGVVVTRDGHEVEFFANKKNAGAWIQHVYGLKPFDAKEKGIVIARLAGRGPKAGDLVTYRGGGKYDYRVKDKAELQGILDHSYGADILSVCFDANTYRGEGVVSTSGGPVPPVSLDKLVFLGLHPTWFWRWSQGYAGAHQGGYFTINVPHWLWEG
jgi:hypothetical protein